MRAEWGAMPAAAGPTTKPRVFSGIQPSGASHLGNYLGAQANYVALQDEYDAIYAIVDLHALTSQHDGARLRDLSHEMVLDLLAVGPTSLLIVEVKRRIDAEKAAQLRLKAASFAEYFPEYARRKVLCAVASVYLDESVIAFLNREKLYGIAMGEETMQVVNLGQF